MAKKAALVLPAGVSLTVETDGLCIETDADIVIEGPPSQPLARLQSNKGNVSIKSPEPVEIGTIRAPEGTIQLSGKVQLDHAEAQTIDFSSGNLKATVLRASKAVNLAGTKLETDVVKAPRVDVAENLKGRATAIDCENELNPHKLRGGFNLDEFVSLMPKGVDTLRTHGIAVPDEPDGYGSGDDYGSSDDDEPSGDDDSEAEQPGLDEPESQAVGEPEWEEADAGWSDEAEAAPEDEASEADALLAAEVDVPEAEGIGDAGELPEAEGLIEPNQLAEDEDPTEDEGFEGLDSQEGAAISAMVELPEDGQEDEASQAAYEDNEAPDASITALAAADTVLEQAVLPSPLPADVVEDDAPTPAEEADGTDELGDVEEGYAATELPPEPEQAFEDDGEPPVEAAEDHEPEAEVEPEPEVEAPESYDEEPEASAEAEAGESYDEEPEAAAEPEAEAGESYDEEPEASADLAAQEDAADLDAEQAVEADFDGGSEVPEPVALGFDEEDLPDAVPAEEAAPEADASPEGEELRAALEDALQSIVSTYADGPLPPPIEQLAALTQQANLDELRTGFHGLWRDLVSHVRETGDYHSNVVTRSFERIQQLLASS